jgi:hypothetical protein
MYVSQFRNFGSHNFSERHNFQRATQESACGRQVSFKNFETDIYHPQRKIKIRFSFTRQWVERKKANGKQELAINTMINPVVPAAGKRNLTDFFAPTNRLQGLVQGGDEVDVDCHFSEILLQGTMQDLLMAGWAWKDVLQVIDGRIVWIDDDTFLADRRSVGRMRSTNTAADDEWTGLYEQSWFSIGVLRRELSVATVRYNVGIYSVGIDKAKAVLSAFMPFLALGDDDMDEIFVDASDLAGTGVDLPIQPVDLRSILEKQKGLRRFTLQRFSIQPDQCLSVFQHSSEDTTVCLEMCQLQDGGNIIVSCLRDNQTPAKLSLRWTSLDDLAFEAFWDAVRANTSLRTLHLVHCCKNSGQINALAAALADNQGLLELRLVSGGLDNAAFAALCRAVGTNATLEVLETRSCLAPWQSLPQSRQTARYQQMVEMLQENTVLQEIRLDFQHGHDNNDGDQYLLAMKALLLRNRYWRKRFPALAAVHSSSTRLALVGRALYSVNPRPDELFMLLSGVLDYLLSNISSSPGTGID